VTPARRQYDVFVLRYVPNVLEEGFANIGVLLSERGEGGFSVSRFLPDWQQVRSFDPDADVEMLASLTQEIKNAWKTPSERIAWRFSSFRSGAHLEHPIVWNVLDSA